MLKLNEKLVSLDEMLMCKPTCKEDDEEKFLQILEEEEEQRKLLEASKPTDKTEEMNMDNPEAIVQKAQGNAMMDYLNHSNQEEKTETKGYTAYLRKSQEGVAKTKTHEKRSIPAIKIYILFIIFGIIIPVLFLLLGGVI